MSGLSILAKTLRRGSVDIVCDECWKAQVDGSYETQAAADKAAVEQGWLVTHLIDETFHTCPACQRKSAA